ncbi:MAG TPA: histidine phosphatase family protein [Pseudomonadales bacterium]|nr:histidine phosphatase family protein [Pseudomonadales bacterium]
MSEQKEFRQQRFTRPPGATEILLVRHGESRAASPDRPFPLVDGQGDPELHPNGEAQAQRVGERLRVQPIGAVYVSKLRRTAQTAAPLCAHLGLTARVDPDLHEVHLGEWEGGLFRMKAAAQDPAYVRMQAEERWDVIPGGEAPDALTLRLGRALARIAAAHPDELVAAFVHGGVIAHCLHMATGSRPFAFTGAENGSISHLVVHDGVIRVRRFNDTTHLEDLDAGSGQMT